MTLNYTRFEFNLLFSKPIVFEGYPIFVIRSVLGKELHDTCCVNCEKKSAKCENCLFNSSCIYAKLFESILDKENKILPGRVRACPPFVMSLDDVSERRLKFSLTLLGNSKEYIDLIYKVLVAAGEKGIQKERIRFVVESVLNAGMDVSQSGSINSSVCKTEIFTLDQDCKNTSEVDYTILLDSPLRIRRCGKELKQVNLRQFFSGINRRLRQAICLYGECGDESAYGFSNLDFDEKEIVYKNLRRWSSRQKQMEPFGGMTGTLHLKGRISAFEKSLLNGAVLFGAGKNTNFGLGKIRVLREEK